MTGPTAVAAATTFVWLGAVLGISFLETPLKFRAPGVTVPIGVGIGRLVFRALNLVEVVLASVTAAATTRAATSPAGGVLLVACWAVLLTQVVVLRPRLDRRAVAVIEGSASAGSLLHRSYVALEFVKAALLPALGVLLLIEGSA